MKKKEGQIAELAGEAGELGGRVRELEMTVEEGKRELRAVGKNAESYRVMVTGVLNEKEEQIRELEKMREIQQKDLDYAKKELSQRRKAEAVDMRARLEREIEGANEQEDWTKQRMKNLMRLLGEGILIARRQRRRKN